MVVAGSVSFLMEKEKQNIVGWNVEFKRKNLA